MATSLIRWADNSLRKNKTASGQLSQFFHSVDTVPHPSGLSAALCRSYDPIFSLAAVKYMAAPVPVKKMAQTTQQKAAGQRRRDRRAVETQATKEALHQKMRAQHLPVSSIFRLHCRHSCRRSCRSARAQDPAS